MARRVQRPKAIEVNGKKVRVSDGRLDLAKAVSLRLENGLSYSDIAKMFNVTKQAAHSAITNFIKNLPNREEIESLDKSRGSMIKGQFYNLLSELLDPDTLQKASLNNRAYALSQLFNMMRLEEGKSTANVSYAEIVRQIKETEEELAKLQSSPAVTPDSDECLQPSSNPSESLRPEDYASDGQVEDAVIVDESGDQAPEAQREVGGGGSPEADANTL